MGTRHTGRLFGINLALVMASLWLSTCDLNPQPLPPTDFGASGEEDATVPSGSGSSNSSSSGSGSSGSSGVPAATSGGTAESGNDSGVHIAGDGGSADGGAFTPSSDAATDATIPIDASIPTDAPSCAQDAVDCGMDAGGDAVATD